MKRKLQHIVIQFLVRHLLRGVSQEDLLLITNKGWVSRGKRLTEEERVEIKQQAIDFSDSILWRYIDAELEYVAFVRGRKATTDSDVFATHYMYWNLDLIRQFIERCKKL